MILAGQLLLDDGKGRCHITPGYVRVDDDMIVEVVEGEIPDVADFGSPDALISPGFIDAHLHLPQFDMIGAHGMPLLRWLDEITFPAEAKWEDSDLAQEMMDRVLSQLLGKGTTGICAFATVHHDSAKVALETATEWGMRGVIGQVLMDRQAPTELCRETAQLLDEASQLGELFPSTGRMAAAVTPRFAVSCSEELLQGAAVISWEQNSMIQSHLAETENECAVVSNLFDGRSYVEVYQESGLLNERAVYGHGIHLDDIDRSMIAQAGAVVAHCPTANSFLRSGTMNRAAHARDDVRLAIGSDIGAGYERSMVRVARAMIEAAATIGEEIPDAAAAWHAITAGNADSLGWQDAGRLKSGSPADIVVIEPDIPWLEAPAEPLANLMFAWDDRWITRTLLLGS
jgi:guanine deaminase